MNRIIISKITGKSVEKDYSVQFKRGLNIIAGESMTGKTSILQLINYCFGDSEYPQTLEFQKLIVALLEIEIDEEFFTIERVLSRKKTATIHFCKIEDLRISHKSIEVNVSISNDEESISSFILSRIGLEGVELKKAPTQEASETNTLSFRDLLWACYLKRSRVGGEQLLFENEYWKNNKLIQIVDIIFNVYSNTAALLSSDLESLNNEIDANEQKMKTILNFLDSQGVLQPEELAKESTKLASDTSSLKKRLTTIDEALTGSSDTAKGLRHEVLGLQAVLQRIKTDKRSMEKNLLLLLPLRSQYHEDIKKLTFLNEAKEIFDPLLILRCPYCLRPLEKNAENHNCCPLCKEEINQISTESKVDVTKEIGIIKRKLDELNVYIEQVEMRIKENEVHEKSTSERLAYLSKQLDESLESFVSPYLSERDELKTSIITNENKIATIDQSLNFRNQIKFIEEEIICQKIKAEKLKLEIKKERTKSVTRIELINSLSALYRQQLNEIHFPKLDNDARIDEKLIPYVKGLKYDKLSSEGAINLSSICWMTTIFEEAIKRSMHHPGFLMLDYIQAGIGIGPEIKEEFQDVAIVKGLYDVLLDVSQLDSECQVIAIDNHPPDYAKDYVIVRYTRDPKKYPYGFIDDETT